MSVLDQLKKWLGQCAGIAVKRDRPFVIAITGSVGKSTTKQAIAALFNACENGCQCRVSAKNYNNELGVPLAILDLTAPGRSPWKWLAVVWRAWLVRVGARHLGVKTLILEMGADKPGDLAYLTSIARPDIAVITAVTPEGADIAPVHLANYPSIDALTDEKATLVRQVKPGGMVILNADDARVFSMRHMTTEHVLTYGENDGADVRLAGTKIRMEDGQYGSVPAGLEIRLESLNRARDFFIPGVFGRPVAYAVAAATAVCAAMDLGQGALLGLPSRFKPLPGRTRIIPGIKFTTLLDDSYNASPAAVISALRDLAAIPLQSQQRRVACLGEMRELGEQAESLHRRVGAEAAKQGIDLLVACGKLATAMAAGALANGLREDQIKVFDDTPEAGRFLQDWIKSGDVILAKASEGTIESKGVRMERVIKELMAEPARAEELLVRQEEAWRRK